MPDVYGPFSTATLGEAGWFRDRGYLEPDGIPGPPAATAGTGELPLTANGLTLSLGLGRAHVRGAYYERTGAAWTYAVPANTNATLDRIDRVVLRRDLAARTVTPVVLQGTPAASPAAPALTQAENGVWEEPLFRVLVPRNSGTVLTITDERTFVDPDTGETIVRPTALTMAAGWGGFGAQYVQRGRLVVVTADFSRTGTALVMNAWTNATVATGLPPAITGGTIQPNQNTAEVPGFTLGADASGNLVLGCRWVQRTVGTGGWFLGSFPYLTTS